MKNVGRNNSPNKLREEMTFPEKLTKNAYNIKDLTLEKSFKTENSNVNINKQLIRNKSFQTQKILDDFKNIIKQTELIKSKIMKSPKIHEKIISFDGNDSNIKFNDNISIINKETDSETGNKFDDLSDFNEIINIKNLKLNYKNNKKNTHRIIARNIFKTKQFDNFKSLKLENKNLGKSNIRLINQNNSLEKNIELLKNKKNKNKLNNKQNYLNYYDENVKKFINNLKISCKRNITENLDLSKKIFNILRQIQVIYNNYNINNIKYQNIFKMIKREEKNIEIPTLKDIKKLDKLKEEQKKLNKELRKLNNNLKDLKTKENILSQKYEYNLKSIQDNQELVNKLNNTINNLDNKQLIIGKISSKKNIFQDYNDSLALYDIKIKQLNSIIKSLKDQRHILKTENYNLKSCNKEFDINNNKELGNLKESELQIKLKDLKEENLKNNKILEKKENQIKFLKDLINKLSKAIKQNNLNDDIFKLNFEKITKDDFNDFEYDDLIKEEILNDKIKKAINLNEMKIKEMHKISKAYDDIINIKENEIIFLENKLNKRTGLLKDLEEKVKPLYKKSILTKSHSYICNKKGNFKNNNKIMELNKNLINKMNVNLKKKINNKGNKNYYINIINNIRKNPNNINKSEKNIFMRINHYNNKLFDTYYYIKNK